MPLCHFKFILTLNRRIKIRLKVFKLQNQKHWFIQLCSRSTYLHFPGTKFSANFLLYYSYFAFHIFKMFVVKLLNCLMNKMSLNHQNCNFFKILRLGFKGNVGKCLDNPRSESFLEKVNLSPRYSN